MVFSFGLGTPFLIIAWGADRVLPFLKRFTKLLSIISVLGGVFLIFIGILLLTNQLGTWTSWFYGVFKFIHYDKLINNL